MEGRFALIPHVATQVAAEARPPAAGASRLALTYDVEVQAGGPVSPRVPLSAALRGPGDVLSIDRAMIARVEPEPGLRGFETNYFPFIEFRDADFPWRFSLDLLPGDRRRPWIALIALKADELAFLEPGGPLPRIRVRDSAVSLPDLGQSWAFAHAEVALPAPADTPASVLPGDPGRSFARLFCPRRLTERTSYFLFLVPAYEAGRLAGLGSRDKAAPYDAPAWTAAPGPVDLPVYHQSTFITDAQEDVELLIRRLRGLRADELAATAPPRRASAATPGYYDGYANPGASFEVQSALRRPGATTPAYGTDGPLADLMATTLTEVIRGEADDDDSEDSDDPLVALPPYGFRYRPESSVDPARAQQDAWFDRTNLDLMFRHAASLGARTVRDNQELFARVCWDQYDELVAANLRLARLQVAEELVKRVSQRHFERLASDAALSLAEPLAPVVRLASGGVIGETLREKGIPLAFAGRALRRQAAKRPVSLAAGRRGKGIPAPAIPGDTTSSAPAPIADPLPARRRAETLALRGLPAALEAPLAPLFRQGVFAAVTRPQVRPVFVASFASRDLAASVAEALKKLPRSKAASIVRGRLPAEAAEVAPLFRNPVVPLPLAPLLRVLSPDGILTGVQTLPENTVSAFEENRSFIEAFLVGANHEMNKELRWREFPTDMRGTLFRRFWDRGLPPNDPAGDEIRPLHQWTGSLGTHFIDASPDLVVVIRGDVIRKLGEPIVVINEAPPNADGWQPNAGQNFEAVFMGRLGPDIAYYGFNVSREHILQTVRDRAFVVIYEPMGRLRFGLDVATAAVRAQRRKHERLSLAFPIKALGRSAESVPFKRPGSGQPPPLVIGSWDDLSWTHMDLGASGYIDFTKTFQVPGQPDLWGAGKTSASLARSFWQRPIAAVMPLGRVL